MKKPKISVLSSINLDLLRFYSCRMEGYLHRLRFLDIKAPTEGWPILFGTSFPKSGTNLLTQILAGFSKLAPFTPPFFRRFQSTGDIRQRVQAVMKYLNSLRPLDVTQAHLLAWPKVVERVCSQDYVSYFIIRDPRDIVVSYVFYVAELGSRDKLSQYYMKNLKSFDERLLASIQGVNNTEIKFTDIPARFNRSLDWLNHGEVHSIRFEDLIHNRRAALGFIADHFLKRVDTLPATRDEIIDKLEESINPKKSPTFRSGKTGEWRKHFTDEHKRAFKDVAGDLLIRLGYESNNDW